MSGWITALVVSVIIIAGVHVPEDTSMTSIRAIYAPDLMSEAYSLSSPPVEPIKVSESDEWTEYRTLALSEYSDEFTALFNGYQTKWAKNGRLMLRNGDSGPYKFVKRTA